MEKVITALNTSYLETVKLLKMNKWVYLALTKYGQVIKFAIAGAAGAVIEIGLFIFLEDIAGMHYLAANLIAITVAILVNYLISHKWVFESGRHSKPVEFMAFVFLSILVVLLNQTLMWTFVDQFALDSKLSKVAAIVIVAVFNFVAKKYLVFKN